MTAVHARIPEDLLALVFSFVCAFVFQSSHSCANSCCRDPTEEASHCLCAYSLQITRLLEEEQKAHRVVFHRKVNSYPTGRAAT